MDLPPAINILTLAKEVVGDRRINGLTGLLQSKLKAVNHGMPIVIDSSAVSVSMMGYGDENERARNESLLYYGICESVNHNTAVLTEQLSIKGGQINTLQEAYTQRVVLPETRTDLSLLGNAELVIELPGFPEKTVDMRAIAAGVKVTGSTSTSRWRHITRHILDSTIPRDIQCVYSGALNATSYYPLPEKYVTGIVNCCAISSGLNTDGMISYLPAISSHVRAALTLRLNEVKKGVKLTIEELVSRAMQMGWTPPGYTRNQIDELPQSNSNSGENEGSNNTDDGSAAILEDNNTTDRSVTITQTPFTTNLKRKGPMRGRKVGKNPLKKLRIPNSNDIHSADVDTRSTKSSVIHVPVEQEGAPNTQFDPSSSSQAATQDVQRPGYIASYSTPSRTSTPTMQLFAHSSGASPYGMAQPRHGGGAFSPSSTYYGSLPPLAANVIYDSTIHGIPSPGQL